MQRISVTMSLSEPKILLVGEWTWPWYQEACAKALEKLGCKVVRFGWCEDFRRWEPGRSEPVYRSFWHRVQHRLKFGPIVSSVSVRLVDTAIRECPEVVWFYNVQLISARTVRQLRKILPKAIFCQYANDNPFSRGARRSLWKNYMDSLSLFDLHFAYRLDNISDLKERGVKRVRLLRSYFLPEEDRAVADGDIEDRFFCDVVFAGHYEDDGRVEALEGVMGAGYRLNLFGGGWEGALPRLSEDSPLHTLYPVAPVTGDHYRQAICGAKVVLCFLSTLNQDTYTRRNFQVPAMGRPMLSQYSDDLAGLFRPNVEIAFFRNKAELLKQLERLIPKPTKRAELAKLGFERVYRDGHDVVSRMRDLLIAVRELR